MNTKHLTDSITLRVNNLRIQPLLTTNYKYDTDIHGKYHYKINKTIVFTIKDYGTNKGEQYQLIEFNGFVKYKNRDKLILKAFNSIIDILKNNDIEFYLNKIDLAIDFYNIDFTDLSGTYRKGKRGVRQNLFKNLTQQELNDIKTNKTTYYLEKPVKANNKAKQRAYIYNKGIKEDLKAIIYRFEVSLYNFNELFNSIKLKNISLEILSINLKYKNKTIPKEDKFKQIILQQEYNRYFNNLLMSEIRSRIDEYNLIYLSNRVVFNEGVLLEIIQKTNNLKGR